jgi:ribose transport system substrate-binding protein
MAAVVIAVAGCSSSGSSSVSSGASSSDASSGAASALVSQAQTAVDAAKKKPTQLPITQPLTGKAASGKTIIYLQCEVAQCALEGRGLESAAQALGWKYRVLNFQAANPATLVSSLDTALQYHPIAVFFSGVPEALWKSVEPKYKAAGAYLVPASVPGVTPDDTIITSLAADALYKASGKLLADEVTALSGGKAEILFATVPTYTIYKPLQEGYEAELAKICPGCSSQTFEATLQQVTSNQMVPAIVSELKRNPAIRYVVSVNGVFVQTLPAALQTAGLDAKAIKVLTHSGTSTVQQLVQSGSFYSTTAFGYQYEGWLGVDAVLRAMQKLPIGPEHELLPLPLLTKDTVGTPADSYDLPGDYQEQFKKLWLLSS